MERSRSRVEIPPDVLGEIPVVCRWNFIDNVYAASLQHPLTEGYRGFIPYGDHPDSGWVTTRSKIKLDEKDDTVSRELTLVHTDTNLKIAFVAIGLPIPWGRQLDNELVVHQISRENRMWVEPKKLDHPLDAVKNVGSMAILANLNIPNDSFQEKTVKKPLVKVKSRQQLSHKKAMRTLDRVGRLLRQTTGYRRPQRTVAPRRSIPRNSGRFSPVR